MFKRKINKMSDQVTVRQHRFYAWTSLGYFCWNHKNNSNIDHINCKLNQAKNTDGLRVYTTIQYDILFQIFPTLYTQPFVAQITLSWSAKNEIEECAVLQNSWSAIKTKMYVYVQIRTNNSAYLKLDY